jgi:hypothetical protein
LPACARFLKRCTSAIAVTPWPAWPAVAGALDIP